MRWLALILGVAILGGVASVVVALNEPEPRASNVGNSAPSSPKPSESVKENEFTDPCGTFDTNVTTPYSITGYWILPTTDRCNWRRQLEAIHHLGGDTVVRIGFGLSPRQVSAEGWILDQVTAEGKDPLADKRYAFCVENSVPCAKAAENDLKAANPENRISWNFTYRTDEQYGDGVFRCPSMERKIVIGDKVFYRLLASEDGSDDATCDFTSKGKAYHLILVSAGATDSLTELLDLGDRFGIKVFPALPLAPRDPTGTTRANPRHVGTLTTLTRRILQDYGDRHAGRESLGGVYQPFELQIRDWAEPENVPTLQVYAEQHRIVEQELPGKPILVSPYLDARRRVGYTSTPKQVKNGFKALARTGVGIIAPQDGRGTGKGGLFWPNWKNQPVDERLKPVVGESTYNTAYYGGTREYYREMSEARKELLGEGVEVQLWANVESFEPSATERCGTQGSRGRTDKPRMDTAVTLVGPYVSKIISYMWTDFYTCGSPSLSEEIARDWDRPVAIQAVREERQIQDGLEIRGYHMQDTKVTLSWSGLETPRVVDAATVGWFDGSPMADLPSTVGRVWIPVDWESVPKDTWVRVEVTSADGRKAAEPVYYRHE
ncbi:hypothetical protein Aple_060530 [Acrocarpospora pleiomorpha]|uniref:DUF4434 domain-containing protein n=1 Tax=Acrocarpospora pleiomorpha TaxID=90975 RepID=A0A5M3XPJ1_9ACTN|nr:DUF4434 domain-containing protein [Acrocarpospora pleiomorpha]GES23154.1 hypothetical protein Aple_060530 [Acrocarpospora pleiomorpha]